LSCAKFVPKFIRDKGATVASIRYLKEQRRWQVRWHITGRDGKVNIGSKLLPKCFTRQDAERERRRYNELAQNVKHGLHSVPESIEHAVQKWFAHNQRHTERTKLLYRRVLVKFTDHLGPGVRFVDRINTRHVHDYLAKMLNQGLTNRTCNSHLTVIKSFCSWVADNYNVANAAKSVKMMTEAPPKVRFLSPAEYEKILKVAAECDWWSRRIKFLTNTGLRASEMCRLRRSDINFDSIGRPVSITVAGKGRKRRVVPVNGTVCKILSEIRDQDPNSHHIFISKSNKKSMDGVPVGRKGLLQMCNKVAELAGVPPFGPHALRHWFATQLLLKGVPIGYVSRLLGHSSIRLTESTYIHWLPGDLAGATDCLD